MPRADDGIQIGVNGKDIIFTADQITDILGTTQRSFQRITYETTSDPTTVYYTALDIDATGVITARTPVILAPVVQYTGYRLYAYDQPILEGMDDFIALWDEGDAAVYKAQWVVVDTRAGAAVAGQVIVIPGGPDISVPGVPLNVHATAGDTEATITWDPPADDGGSPVISYTITAIDSTSAGRGGQTNTNVTATPTTVIALTNGDNYTFTVTAQNAVGNGVPSAASNSVSPTATLTVPTAPLAPSASASSGQAVVTFTTPLSDGNSAILDYTVTAVDETNGAHGGQTSTGASSPRTVTGLTNNETYYFTVKARNAIGFSPQSVATNTVVPNPTGAGAGIATFTTSQLTSSTVSLDATGSVGTLTWNVDGVDSFAHTTTLQIGPLVVGSHTIKLTAVGTTTATSQIDMDVAWIGKPIGTAQHDPTNGHPGWWGAGSGPYGPSPNPVGDGLHSTNDLPQWSSLPVIGPWRNITVVNTAEVVPPGDGVPRIDIISDNEVSLLTQWGDHPGTSGGFRSALEMTNAYVANTSGLPFATSKNIDCCGHGSGTGFDGRLRFYRIEMKFPASNPSPMLYQNNAFEIHGATGGSSPIRFQTDGAGNQFQWAFEAIQNGSSGGQKNWSMGNILYDTWYNFVLEIIWDLDPSKGYVRIFRDGAVLTGAKTPAGTLPDGRYFAPTGTQQTDNTGHIILMAFDIQNYRTRATMPSNYPDAIIHYRNIAIGPTLASVSNL